MKNCQNCKYCVKEYWKYEYEFRKGSEIRSCQRENIKRAKRLAILRIVSVLFMITTFILINPAVLLIEGNPDKLTRDIIDYMLANPDYSVPIPMSYDSISYSLLYDDGGLKIGMSFERVVQIIGSPNLYFEDKKYMVALWCMGDDVSSKYFIITFKNKIILKQGFYVDNPRGRIARF